MTYEKDERALCAFALSIASEQIKKRGMDAEASEKFLLRMINLIIRQQDPISKESIHGAAEKFGAME